MAFDVVINKKFNYVRLYNVKRSVKGEQNAPSKFLLSLVNKYFLKKKPNEGGSA